MFISLRRTKKVCAMNTCRPNRLTSRTDLPCTFSRIFTAGATSAASCFTWLSLHFENKGSLRTKCRLFPRKSFISPISPHTSLTACPTLSRAIGLLLGAQCLGGFFQFGPPISGIRPSHLPLVDSIQLNPPKVPVNPHYPPKPTKKYSWKNLLAQRLRKHRWLFPPVYISSTQVLAITFLNL